MSIVRVCTILFFLFLAGWNSHHAAAASLADNNNGTVTDSRTGLVWQQEEPGAMAWGDALNYCEGLSLGGSNDWRLPNVMELESLTDDDRYYPAIDTAYFPNAVASYYWSSTTSAGNPCDAWDVNFDNGYVNYSNKDNNFYVRCVRGGQSGSLGSLVHFEFSPISSPQAVNTFFPSGITITAKDSAGNTLTSLNGTLSLSASIGGIYPTSALMQSGVATINEIYVTSPGTLTIHASLGYNGSSLPFVVSGATNSASVMGKVVNGAGGAWVGATVHLEMGSTTQTTTTDSTGKYSFANLVPGQYSLWAQESTLGNRSIDYTAVKLGDGTPAVQNIEISNAICNPTTRTPVLLVPGIMGSSVGWGGPYPILPKNPPNWKEFPKTTSSWGLHDPLRNANDNLNFSPGWRDLVEYSLEPRGYQKDCTIFPVPYDWRMDINDAAREYLKKWIDEAKRKAGTSKVNIIAHSMGGLVTRAYIQSSAYDYDIDRFAMVGTPNHGSSLTYYMVEGGDPAMADTVSLLKNPSPSYVVRFYQNTTEKMYKTFHWLPLAPEGTYAYKKQIYNLYGDHIPSAAQLLPTYDFLSSDNGLETKRNQFLIDLNWDSNITRMGNEAGRVITKLFAGNGSNTTLKSITTGPKNLLTPLLYKDGVPISPLATTAANGDGTVLKSSASLGLDLEQDSETAASHAGLIGAYKDDIVSFIDSDAVPYPSSVSKTLAAKTMRLLGADASTPANEVSVMLFGRARIMVTDPQGLRSGIEPTTGELLDEIPESNVAMDEEKAAVSFSSAGDGIYTITVKSTFAEDYRLNVSYLDAAAAEQKEYYGFNNATTSTVTFSINSAATEKLSISLAPLPPSGLQADAFASGGLKTKLTWTASTDPNVTGYNVYAKYIDAPYLARIGTSNSAALNTDHPWAENSSVMARLYAVAAIKADGTESFLSNMVQNDDRDHDGLTDAEELTLGTDPTKTDTDGDGYSDSLEGQRGSNPVDKLSIPQSFLTAVLSGTGKGAVVNTAAGIACSGDCSIPVALNTTISLQATPAEYSLFSGWADACSGVGACSVLMDNDKSVTATFTHDTAHAVRLDLPEIRYFPSILDAYTSATSPATIKAWGTDFTENLLLDKDSAVTIKGGFDAGYAANNGVTILHGTLTVKKGSLTIENLVVQ